MFDWFLCLETSDKISLISTISSFCLAFVAIWQSNQSIRLTKQSIFEANRPVVVIYLDYINVLSSVHEYLVIKNFGNTTAKVTNIQFDKPIKRPKSENTLFTQGVPFILAPGQSFPTIIRNNVFQENENHIYTVTVTYNDFNKTYQDTFVLNQALVENYAYTKSSSSSSNVGKIISYSAEEFLRRQL